MADLLKINSGSQQSSYTRFEYTLAAGEVKTIVNPYNYFTCLESTSPFDVAWSTNRSSTGFEKGLQVHFKNDELIPSVTITNTAATANHIVVGMGCGNFQDNRLVLGTGATLSTYPAQFTSFAASTQTIASGKATIPAAKKVIIQNTSTTNSMYIGSANGLELQAGGTFEFSLSIPLDVYGTDSDVIAIGSFN